MAGGQTPALIAQRLRLGGQLVELRRYDDAAAIARDVLALEPERVEALKLLTRALLGTSGRTATREALQAIGSAAGIAPDDADVLYLLGFTQFRLGNVRAADRSTGASLQRRPAHIGALWLRCQIEMRRKRRKVVFETLHALVVHSADTGFSHQAMGRVALWLGQRSLAGRHLQRAMAERPDDPELLRLLAKARVGKHDPERGSLDPLLRALRAAPAHEGAAADLRRAAGGRINAVAGVAAAAYAGALLIVAAALGAVAHLAVQVAGAGLFVLAYQLVRLRVRHELPREAVVLVERARPVALWPFALAILLALPTLPSDGTRWLVLLGAAAASLGANLMPALRVHRRLAVRARVVGVSLAGYGLLAGSAVSAWGRLSLSRQGVLAAALVLCVAGTVAAAYEVRHPHQDPLFRPQRTLPPAVARLTLVAAFLPWWALLGTLALPFIVLLSPLLLTARLRRSRLSNPQIAVVAGAGALLEGMLGAGLVLALGGRRYGGLAIFVLVLAASIGVSLAARARWEAVPDWMQLDAADGARPTGA